MMGTGQKLAGVGAVALGWAISGCSASDVSAGSEGNAVNLSRCFGADCGVRAQSLTAVEPDALPCGEVVGELQDRLAFEPIAADVQARAIDAQEASDGSVWAIQSVTSLQRGNASIYLTHHSADGALLAVSDAIVSEGERTLIDAAVALDVNDAPTVAAYSSYAETADSDIVEHLTLYAFDGDLQAVGQPRAFRGVARPHMVGGPLGSIWLAGNAENLAKHGAISRITQGEPEWIQTALPTSGQSVSGVSGLTVADDGFAAVVAQLNDKWSGSGPDFTKLGVATFDENGTPLWTLALPADYAPGYGGGIGGTAAGNLVVAGMVGAGDTLLIQGVSREGQQRWSYRVEGALSPGIDVRRDSGRTFAGAQGGVAVIDEAGESCRVFSIPPAAEGEVAPWRADAEYLLAVGGELTRLRVPE